MKKMYWLYTYKEIITVGKVYNNERTCDFVDKEIIENGELFAILEANSFKEALRRAIEAKHMNEK